MSDHHDRTDYLVHDTDSLMTARWVKAFADRTDAATYANAARGFADTVTITTKVHAR